MNKYRVNLGKRFPIKNVLAQMMTILILWQMLVPFTSAKATTLPSSLINFLALSNNSSNKNNNPAKDEKSANPANSVTSDSKTTNINKETKETNSSSTKKFIVKPNLPITPLMSTLKPTIQLPGDTVVVKHAPGLNAGRVEGSIRLLNGEGTNVNSGFEITGDLIVPGLPNINFNGSNRVYNGTIEGTGSSTPSYSINVNDSTKIRHIVTRTNAISVGSVTAPAQPTGTRSVALNAGQSPGDFTTLRDLTLNSSYGSLTIPPGTYGNFTANSGCTFVFGTNGQNTTYNLQSLNLNTSSQLQIQGNVTITINNQVSVSSSVTVGSSAVPSALVINIANGGLNLNSNSAIYATINTPTGTVNVNSLIKGLVICNYLNLNSGGVIKGLVTDTQAPVITITQPNDQAIVTSSTISVLGTYSDDSVITSIKANNINATITSTGFTVTNVPLSLGSNTITVTATDYFGNSSQTSIVVYRGDGINQAPTANAGANQTINQPASVNLVGTASDDGKPNPPATLTYAWTKVSGPGVVTFSNPSSLTTSASFSQAGTYVLNLQVSDSQLATNSTVTIIVNPPVANQAPVVSAGVNQTITLPATASLIGTATDDGLPNPPAALTYTWAKVSGAGTVTFSAPTSLTTTATFSSAGTYVLSLTANDSQLSTTANVTITVNSPANQAPVVSAGSNQTITLPATASLIGTATDDGLPNPPAQLTYSWAKVSGAGTVTFSAPTSLNTTATFSSAGTYVLSLTANDSLLSTSSNVTITVNPQPPQNQAPIVNAGANQTITLPATASLVGTATDDGLPNPPAALTISWTKVSGAGTVTFSNPSSLTTTASFSVAGTYTLRLSVSDSILVSSSDLTITVNPQPVQNQAPTASAGANQTIKLEDNLIKNPGNESALVNSKIPNWTEVTGTWTQAVAGSNGFPSALEGNTYFYAGNSASGELSQDIDVSAFASAISTGTQKFEFRGYVRSSSENPIDLAKIIVEYRDANNVLASFDSTAIASINNWQFVSDLRNAPVGTTIVRIRLIATKNSGTTNDAFFDNLSLRVASLASTALTGTATDDGLPNPPATLTYAWSKVSGAGTVVFTQPNQLATSVSFNQIGTYVLRLTVSDSALSSTSDVTITVTDANTAPVVNAGTNQTITLPATASLSGSYIDDGIPVGGAVTNTWSMVSGSGTVTFSNPSSLATTVTFSVAGTYVLRLTVSDSVLSSTSDVTITVNPAAAQNTAPIVSAGANQTITLPATANLTGTATDDGLPNPPATLTYSWSKVTGTGTVTFSASTSLTTTATFSVAGTYVLRLTVSDSVLSTTSDVTITVNPAVNQAPVVNAGQNQNIVVPYGPNLIKNSGGEGQIVNSLPENWMAEGGYGTGWIKVTAGTPPYPQAIEGNSFLVATPSSNSFMSQVIDLSHLASSIDSGTQTFSFNAYVKSPVTSQGTGLVLEYRSNNNLVLSKFDSGLLTVTDWTLFTDLRSVPVGTRNVKVYVYSNGGYIDALSLRALLNTQNLASTTLSATVTDDGLPNPPAQVTLTWSKVSGLGQVSFSNPNLANTNVTFSDLGTYVLRLTASDSVLTSTSDVTVTVKNINNTANVTVNAGADQTVAVQYSINLLKNAGGEANLVNNIPQSWTQVGGFQTAWVKPTPGSNGFPSAVEGNSYFAAIQAGNGSYIYQDIDVSTYSSSIDAGNQKFVFNCYARGVDSNQVADVVVQYKNSLGQVIASFDTRNVTSTDWILFTDIRTAPISTRIITVLVYSSGGFIDALSLRAFGSPVTSINLTGSILEGNNPVGDRLYTEWSKVSGIGNVTFSNPNKLTTSVSFTDLGTYVIRLTASDLGFSLSDDVTITVNSINTTTTNQAPIVNAGVDQTVTFPASANLVATATDDGLPNPPAQLSYFWTKVSGPGSVTFSNPNQLATQASFTKEGVYVLRVTTTDSSLFTSDDITVNVLANGSDLIIKTINTQSLNVNGQSLNISGTLSADIANVGSVATSAFVVTFFEDLNNNGLLDASDHILATVNHNGLAANSTSTISIPISSTVQFANTPIYGFIDSGQVINEANENNNYAVSNAQCQFVVTSESLNPTLKFSWTSSSVLPQYTNVMMTPAVADINGDGIPDIIFSSFYISYGIDGHLRAISGKDGSELFTVTNPAYNIIAYQGIAVGDIDGDGIPEIIAAHESGNKLIAFNHDGSFKWFSPVLLGVDAPALIDLDGDGLPEILVGTSVLNHDGSLRWTNFSVSGQGLFVAADLDLDGVPEILTGNAALRADGSIMWSNPNVSAGFVGVGNFNSDPFPEIVVVKGFNVYLLSHTGQIIWGPVRIPTAVNLAGPPLVADLDGDGVPEIGIATSEYYIVLNADGTLKWTTPTQDGSSGITGSSAFDLDGDGKAEVIYGDEFYLRIYKGSDGTVLAQFPLGSQTVIENPVVADVDADGSADIIAPANDFHFQNHGIFVYSNPRGRWVNTRKIWNQYTYHITNINDDATVPRKEDPSWLKYNVYRSQQLTGGCQFVRPDLAASYVRKVNQSSTTQITVRIGNGGQVTAKAGISVGFYNGNPSAGGILLKTVNTTIDIAPSKYEDIVATFDNSVVANPLWIYVDNNDALYESNETNNIYNSFVLLGINNQAPVVSAGTNQTITLPATVNLVGTATDDGLPNPPATLTYSWSKVSGAGTVTFSAPTSLTTTATFSVAGSYVLRLTVSDSDLSSTSDVTITVNPTTPQNQAPVVSAGTNQTITLPSTASLVGTATDDGLPNPPATLSYSWSKVSGSGTVTFSNPTSLTTTATFSVAGTYVLSLTASDSQLSATATVTITVNPAASQNQAPIVSAGTNQTITLPATASLTGTATDDGLPNPPATLTYSWSKVSGAGTVTFSNPTSLTTTAIFSIADTYILRLSVSDSALTTTSDVTIMVNPVTTQNQAPTANAGTNQTIKLEDNLVQNPGNESALVNGQIPNWQVVSGTWSQAIAGSSGLPSAYEGNTYFYASTSTTAELKQEIDLSSFASTIAAGTQMFQFNAFVRTANENPSDSPRIVVEYLNSSNNVITTLDTGNLPLTTDWTSVTDQRLAPATTSKVRIRLIATRNSGATNDAYFDFVSFRPVASAATTLQGIATDDGLPNPPAQLTTTWTKVSGPGTVSFATPNQLTTGVVFSVVGSYVLRLTASDSELSTTSDVTITVNNANTPPTVNAGTNQTITLPATASLLGTATDDRLPIGSTLTYSWSKVSGSGTVTFSAPTNLITTASFSVAGTYVLRLTVSDSQLSSTSDITITVNPATAQNQAPVVSAGQNQTITLPATASLVGTATDDGLPNPPATLTYNWAKVSGAGTVTFSAPTSLTTTASFSVAGTYVLSLTASDSQLSTTANVTITVNAAGQQNQAPVVNAGTNQTVAITALANLNGSATDDGLPTGSTLQPTWSKFSGPGTVTFSNANSFQTQAQFSVEGSYVLRLSVSDSQLTGTADVTITVFTPQTPAPTVAIISPTDGKTITSPTDIFATITFAGTATWTISYSLNADEDFDSGRTYSILASGTQQVTNSKIATLDPTLMLNGSYLLRLQATDDTGRTATIITTVVLDKGLKVGNFTLSFADLNVPVAGIPMTVNRTYDSRDKRVGDFGVGWNLDIRNIRLEKTSNLGTGWVESLSGNPPFTEYALQPSKAKIVTITFPDGQVFKFDAKPKPDHQIAAITQLDNTTTTSGMLFVAEAGTQGTLVSIDAQDLRVEGDIPQVSPSSGLVQIVNNAGQTPGQPYNPYLFKLTTLEGREFIIDERYGLQSVKDLSGNTLTITANGITHSSGKSITFTRDTQGRITKITDPNNNVTNYTYNAAGDLTSVTDAENNTTSFSYTGNHYLLDITDPRGIKPIRNDYDSENRLIKHTDSFGHVINYTYQIGQRLETITDRLGNPTIFEYDSDGNVVKKTDALGNVTTFTFDANDNQLTETNALGKTSSSTYDAVNNKLTDTDALGNTITYTYNNRRQLLTVTDAKGAVTTNTYDLDGNRLTTKDALNNTTTNTYTPVGGLVATTTDALGGVTSYQYTPTGQVSQITDAQGHIATFTYDQNNNQLTSTVSRTINGSLQSLTTTSIYDKLNRATKVTYPDGSFTVTMYNAIGKVDTSIDQLGHRTSYSYDNQGQLISTTFADGTSTSATYDFEGRRITSVDQLGRAVSFQYDVLGRLKKTIAADNSFTASNYDAIGRVSSTTDQLGHTTSYEYDPNCGCSSRKNKITDNFGNVTTFTYDQNGNESSSTDARNNTIQRTYDELNRLTKVTFADGTSSSIVYDALNHITSQPDQEGNTKQNFYDSLGRLIKVKDELNNETQYTYDELGLKLSQVDAKGRTTSYEYDQLGNRVKRVLPLGQFETYSYDNGGRLTSHTDFKGKVTTFTYDNLNRLLSKTPDPSFNQVPIAFTYNTVGQRLSMTDVSGTTTYSYDNLTGRLTSKATPQGTLFYTNDTVGNLLTLRSSSTNGVSIDYSYDELNRLQTVQDNNLAAGQNQTSHTYDQASNLSTVTLPNQVITSYNYNSLNHLTSVASNKGTTQLSSYTYLLSNSGNKSRVSELSGRVVNYTYDSIYRLTNETISGANNPILNGSVSYTYDQVGNRLSRTSTLAAIPSQQNVTVDNNDRLTSDNYDNNGSTIGADGRTYTYDFENRIIEVTGNNLSISIKYDGDGNRVEKTVNGVTTKYLVDDNNLTGYAQVVEEIQNNVVTRQYTYGLDLISQGQLIANDRFTSFYLYDGHGSVRGLTNSSGTLTDQYDYDAFGNLISQVGSTPNLYLYAGEQYDPDLGLYYNRARYLDVDRGRFWSQDSYEGNLIDPNSLHKYSYVEAEPINNIDPSGLTTIAEEGAAADVRLTLNTRSANTLTELQKTESGSNGKPKAWVIYEAFSLNKDPYFGYHFYLFAGSIQSSGIGYRYDVIILDVDRISKSSPSRDYKKFRDINPYADPSIEVPGIVFRKFISSSVPPTIPNVEVVRLTEGQFELFQVLTTFSLIKANDSGPERYINEEIKIRYQFPASCRRGTTDCIRWTYRASRIAQAVSKFPI